MTALAEEKTVDVLKAIKGSVVLLTVTKVPRLIKSDWKTLFAFRETDEKSPKCNRNAKRIFLVLIITP